MAKPRIPYKDVCVGCDQKRWIVRRNPRFCNTCNIRYKNERRKEKGKSSKPPRRNRTGEKDLFGEIWGSKSIKERVSFVTGEPLPDRFSARAWYFSHVLPKGKYPEFRLKRENIVLMTLEEHSLWENYQFKIKDDPQWAHVFKLKEKLIQEYKEQHV